jgi:hypothetical protein
MSNLISGTTSSNFLNNNNRSSFRLYAKNSPVNNASDLSTFNKTSSLTKTTPPFGTLDHVGFIDDLVSTTQTSTLVNDLNSVDSSNNNAVYNFPWDFKLKSNSLLQEPTSQPLSASTKPSAIQNDSMMNNSVSTSLLVPPPLPSMPPPQTIRQLEKSDAFSEVSNLQMIVNKAENFQSSSSINIMTDLESDNKDESQYCAPWDLKVQEEMLKIMAQKQQNQSKNTLKPDKAKNENELNIVGNTNDSFSLKRDNAKNNSPKSTSNQAENSKTLEKPIQSDEYSLPWENKQSLLLQNLVTNASLKQSTISLSQSSNSTITSNRQNITATQVTKQSNQNILSPRESTSSSSSTHSSTSSLSTNSHASIPSLPLPPTMPPPPPPLPNNSLLSSVSGQINQHNILQKSPRLPQKQPLQNQLNSTNLVSSQLNSFNILPNNNTLNSNLNNNILQNNNSNVSVINQNGSILLTKNTFNSSLDQNYLNEKNKFSSWGNNGSSSINPLDVLTVNSLDGRNF